MASSAVGKNFRLICFNGKNLNRKRSFNSFIVQNFTISNFFLLFVLTIKKGCTRTTFL